MGFSKQEELLGILSPEWQEKQRNAHSIILEQYPFDDLAGLRAAYCGELRKKGLPETEIDALAYEKFPK